MEMWRSAPVGERYKVRHRANLGIAIVQEYCNCGLGTILMQEGIAFAREAGYEQAELGYLPIMRLQSTCITSAVFGTPEEFRGLSICRMAAASMKFRW